MWARTRWQATGALVSGAAGASWCRRYIWPTQPHGATVLTTAALVAATVFDAAVGGGPSLAVGIASAVCALATAYT